MSETWAVEMAGITKSFRGVPAIRHADLSVKHGEIHAIVGENGAGKSTLMNILYGLYRPDAGTMQVKGETITDHSPNDAVALGIGMVHQHFMLVPPFSVLDNIILGIEDTEGPFLKKDRVADMVTELGNKYGLKVDLDAAVETLPVSMQQRVEILKVLVRGARILILDEPTAVLTPQEVIEFFQILRMLRDQGATILLITHKLREVKELSDRVTVMREGRTVATTETANVDEQKLAEMMVGRPVLFQVDKKPAAPGEVRLAVENLVYTEEGRRMLDGISLSIKSGEIVGLAGVTGNGQTELVLAIIGLLQGVTGSIRLDGTELAPLSVRERQERGLSHIAEDRLKHAVIPDYSIADNVVVGRHYMAPFSSRTVLDFFAIGTEAEAKVREYDVRPPLIDLPVRQLSGGNQQKVVIARECTRNPRFLIAAMPTRGVDIGAIEFIHKRLVELRDRGVAILLVSSELSEILSLADRIAVIYRGKINREMPAAEANESQLGLAMAGVS